MKPVPSCEGYFAGEDGFIYRNGKRRKSTDNGHGYLRIKVSIRGKQKDKYVHRMVCEAYHGPCPAGMDCRHFDGTRSNNIPTNLQWSDKATNEKDKIAHDTLNYGERNGAAKLTESLVLIIRERAAKGEAFALIAQDLGFGRAVIGDAATGRRWKHLPGAVPRGSTRHRDSSGKWAAGHERKRA